MKYSCKDNGCLRINIFVVFVLNILYFSDQHPIWGAKQCRCPVLEQYHNRDSTWYVAQSWHCFVSHAFLFVVKTGSGLKFNSVLYTCAFSSFLFRGKKYKITFFVLINCYRTIKSYIFKIEK